MGIGRILSDLIEERGMTVSEVARETGISANTLYSTLNRDSDSMNIRELSRIADCLHTSMDELKEQLDAQIEMEEIAARNYEEPAPRTLKVRLVTPKRGCVPVSDTMTQTLRADFEFFRVQDSSMNPPYAAGDVVIVARSRSVKAGDVGVYERGAELCLRRRTIDGLSPNNPYYPTMKGSDFHCRGLVVGKLRLPAEKKQPEEKKQTKVPDKA